MQSTAEVEGNVGSLAGIHPDGTVNLCVHGNPIVVQTFVGLGFGIYHLCMDDECFYPFNSCWCLVFYWCKELCC